MYTLIAGAPFWSVDTTTRPLTVGNPHPQGRLCATEQPTIPGHVQNLGGQKPIPMKMSHT